jgi:hypothetical protein
MKPIIKEGTAAICSLVVLLGAQAASVTPPKGYRFPVASDRGDEPTQNFHIVGDFNGDSAADEAWLLPRTDDKGWAVVMFLGVKGGGHKVLMLEEYSGPSPVQSYSLEVLKPGRYKTACGKGYWECKRDERPELNLRLPAISWVYIESANTVFWWDAKRMLFRRTQMSD